MPNAQVLKNRANNLLSGFSAGQRVVVILAAVMLLGGGALFAQWAAKPNMVPLYSNLSGDDASQITTKLASAGVKYELTDGGNTIMVPQSKVYQTRIDMAGAGLPSGGQSGYTLLDKQGITTSDFLEHVDYKRALEGELAKTIQSIDGVQSASVMLVIPENDVFTNDAKKPTASVLVSTRASKSLTTGQTQSIVNLVAGGVEGLSPEDVTVADDKGRMLASPGQGVTGGDSDGTSAAKNALENDLNTKIQNLLSPLVGKDKAVVQASATLNWDKVKQTSEVYNPNNKQPNASSQATKTETYNNAGGTAATGCLGAGVQVTSAACQAASTAGGSGTYSTNDVTQDNKLDRTVTETETTPGAVERLTVAVLLDSNVPNIDTAQVTALVNQAAGIQAARGDTVTVSRMPFDTAAATSASEELKAADKAKKSAQMMNMIKTGVTVMIILAVLAMLFITTKKKAANYTSTPISLAELDAAMPELPSADDMMGELEAAPNSPEAIERAKVDKEITNLIEKQPDEVASLLRSWLADRRS